MPELCADQAEAVFPMAAVLEAFQKMAGDADPGAAQELYVKLRDAVGSMRESAGVSAGEAGRGNEAAEVEVQLTNGGTLQGKGQGHTAAAAAAEAASHT